MEHSINQAVGKGHRLALAILTAKPHLFVGGDTPNESTEVSLFQSLRVTLSM